MRKVRERHVFLFDLYLLLAKEVKDTNGVVKYIYKNKLTTSELGVTEHIEGDECKFAVWTGTAPMFHFRIVLKANCLESKQTWIKRLREVIQETCFSGPSFSLLKSPAKVTGSKSNGSVATRYSNNPEEPIGPCDNDPDKTSLLSFGSGNTTDSEKVSSAILIYDLCYHIDELCDQKLYKNWKISFYLYIDILEINGNSLH